jgi:hypothetical protein
MSDEKAKSQPKVPPPPPRQPDEDLKGYIERGNKPESPRPQRDRERN